MITFNTNFASWLKQRRISLDLTRKSLAECVGCSPKTVEKIESGERRPSRQIIQLLLACLNVPDEEKEPLLALARAEPGGVRAAARYDPASRLPNNLPAPLTAFVGRENEVAEVRAQLDSKDVRLMTLVGPPGIGKTRLALRVAQGLLHDDEAGALKSLPSNEVKGQGPQFGDGLFFVSLAAIRESDLVLSTIAQALGVRESGARPLFDALKASLRDKRLLIVLDNFEQIVSAGPLVTELLASAPGVKALVTSREVLHVYGERIYTVPPMRVPGAGSTRGEGAIWDKESYSTLSTFEAVRLFLDRASAVRYGFTLHGGPSEADALHVVEICRRLDGLPLAIELAAARMAQFNPDEIQARLENKLDLLVGGPSDLPARQRTLRGAVEWSYSLLNEAERLLFRRLSVFVGGCTPTAAAAVAAEQTAEGAAEAMRALAGKSLLVMERSPTGTERYRMLEVINEYAREELEGSGEKEAIEKDHAQYYLGLAEEAEPKLTGSEQGLWLDRLEEEHDNLRAAFRWLLEHDSVGVLRLCAALALFWYRRGYLSEGRGFLAAALEVGHAAPDVVRARAYNGAGTMAYAQGDYAQAERFYRESLSANRKSGDRVMSARALNNLGLVASNRADYPAARRFYEESLGIWENLGDQAGTALTLNNLMAVSLAQGDYVAARSIAERSVVLRKQLGDQAGLASSLSNLGIVMLALGNSSEARALQEESLHLRTDLGDRHGIANCLLNLAEIARHRADYAQAEELSNRCLAICRELGDKPGIVNALINLGHIAHRQGDMAKASTLFASSLEGSRDMGDRARLAHGMSGLAGVAGSLGQAEKAAVVFGAVDGLLQAIGSPLYPHDQSDYESDLEAARSQMDEKAWHEAWQRGREMEPDEAARYALREL